MKYQKIYNEIINRAKLRELDGYKEKHHIIPKCLGGSNDKSNLVNLTAREHFICHKLLTEIHPDENGLHYAVFRMTHKRNAIGEIRNYRIGAREYQRLREIFIEKIRKVNQGKIVSPETKSKISKYNLGKAASVETRVKMSNAHTGKIISADTRLKMSESQTGRKHSEESKQNSSLATTQYWNNISDTERECRKTKFVHNTPHSEESRKKISKQLTGRKLSKEHKQKISESMKRIKNKK